MEIRIKFSENKPHDEHQEGLSRGNVNIVIREVPTVVLKNRFPLVFSVSIERSLRTLSPSFSEVSIANFSELQTDILDQSSYALLGEALLELAHQSLAMAGKISDNDDA